MKVGKRYKNRSGRIFECLFIGRNLVIVRDIANDHELAISHATAASDSYREVPT